MQPLPKVSVAIVTYNQEDFIHQTIESVLIQDYENIEIIVSDDGSTDKTPDILRDYASRYPKLFKIIIGSENIGIARNFNRAFFACDGKYIAWLGGDDVFYPRKIRSQVDAMEMDADCDLSYHAVRVFDSNTDSTIAITNQYDKTRRNLQELLYDGVALPGSAVMVRRSSCPEQGFNIDIPRANDWLFFMETMIHGYAVRIDGVLGGYRIHDNNVTSKSLLDDMHKTFERIRILRPDLSKYANRAESIAYYHEGRKILDQGDNFTARRIFLAGIKLSFDYIPLWKWLAFASLNSQILKRLKRLSILIKGAIKYVRRARTS